MRLLILLLAVANSVIQAFALAYLWRLFAAPLGAPEIGALHAWGLSVLVGLCTLSPENMRAAVSRDAKDPKEQERDLGVQIGWLLAVPLTMLIVHLVVVFFGPVA